MQREPVIVRLAPFNYPTHYIHYSIEKWFENYYSRPASDKDYDIDSELMQELNSFFSTEFEQKPILIINTLVSREWFYEEPRKIINPIWIADKIAKNFDVVIKTELGKEEHITGCEKYVFKRLKMNSRNQATEKIKIASYQFRKFKEAHTLDRTHGVKLWIHDLDEFSQYQNREILYFTAESMPNDLFFRLWSPKKVVCVQSFEQVKHPD